MKEGWRTTQGLIIVSAGRSVRNSFSSTRGRRSFERTVPTCRGRNIHIEFTKLESKRISRTYHSAPTMCFERANQVVSLATCNETLQTQHGLPRRMEVLKARTMDVEISQVGFENHCMTQHHQPQHGEDIYMDRCTNAIRDNTEFWNTF